MATFAPADFLARLEAGSLPDPVNLTLVCLIRLDEAHSTGFLVSPAPGGETWLPISLDAIRSIDHLGTVPPGDPLVRLTLEPAALEGTPLQSLIRRRSDTMAAEALSIGASLQAQAGPPDAAQGTCIIYQGMEGLYVCCPPPPGSGGPYVCTGMV